MKHPDIDFHSKKELRPSAQDMSYIYCSGYPPSAPLSNLGYNLDTAEQTNSCNKYHKQANEQNLTNYSTEQNQLGHKGPSNCHTQGFDIPEKMTMGKELHLLKQIEVRPSSQASSRARPDDLDI